VADPATRCLYGGLHLTAPVVGTAVDNATSGYWLVARDGGVFSFGAQFFGSTGGIRLNAPVVDMTPSADDRAYLLTASDGGVFNFGTARFHGSAAVTPLNAPVVGITTRPAEQPVPATRSRGPLTHSESRGRPQEPLKAATSASTIPASDDRPTGRCRARSRARSSLTLRLTCTAECSTPME
jgi:hypothetical protein